MEGEAVITQSERDAQRQRQKNSVGAVAVDNGLTFMGHGLQLTCLWLVLLYVSVADAATLSRIGHTAPTRLAEQATTVLLGAQVVLLYRKVGNSGVHTHMF